MQTVAMRSPVIKQNMYDVGIRSMKPQGLRQASPLLRSMRDVVYGSAAAQKVEEWDNGDPPDVMLWGEE